MVGRYPRDELWRVVVALVAIAGYGGVVAGHVHRRQVRAGTAEPPVPLATSADRGRGSALAARSSACCSSSRSAAPSHPGSSRSPSSPPRSRAGSSVVGSRCGTRRGSCCSASCSPCALVVLLTRPVGWDDWGGIMLNLFLAIAGIALVLPARCAAGARAPLAVAAAPDRLDRLHRALPWCSAVRAAAALGDRPGVLHPVVGGPARSCRPCDRRVHPVHRRLHRRDRPRRAAVVAEGPDRGRPGARPVAGPDHVPDRAAAGAPQRDPGDRRPVHQPVQGHDAGGRSRRVPRGVQRVQSRDGAGPSSRASNCSPSRSRSSCCCSGSDASR